MLVQNENVSKTTITSDINFVSLEFPKTTLRFKNLLEGLIELVEAIILAVIVYYHERLLIKISNKKGT